MAQSYFAEGIGEIKVAGGVARIEFFIISSDAPKPGEPGAMRAEHTLTVAMPLAGFAASLKSIDDIKQKLIEGGVLKVSPDSPAMNSPGETRQ